MIYTILFIIYFLFAIYIDIVNKNIQMKYKILPWFFVIITLIVGFRNPYAWADTGVYAYCFQMASNLSNYTLSEKPIGYSERGFYFLTVSIKTISDNIQFFLLLISSFTFYFLYKFDKKYCSFPFLAMAIYMARFLVGRNNMQIRAGLSIPLVLLSINYVYDKKFWRFLLVILVGYCLHHSMLIALPIYLVNFIKIRKKHVSICLILSFLVAAFGGDIIRNMISNSDFVQDMATSYVQEDSEKSYGSSLANPMIYYQCVFLLLFTFMERKLSNATKYYYIVRSAYLYSTILLIILCQYAIVAGRTSTIFATFEMIIVPLCLKGISIRYKNIFLAFLFILYSAFFYMNWKPVQLTDAELQNAIMQSK